MINAILVSGCLLGVDHALIGPVRPAAPKPPVVMLEVWHADWCAPCQRMAPHVARLQQEGWRVSWVDADQYSTVKQQRRITGLPTTVVLVDGRERLRRVGYLTYWQLRAMMANTRRVRRSNHGL